MHPKYAGRLANGQFAPNCCGNPRGRPPRSRSTRAVLQQMLQSKVPTKVDGKIVMLTVVEAMAARIKREALAGPMRGLEKGLSVAEKYSLPDPPEKEDEPADLSRLTTAEKIQFENLISKVLGLPSALVDTNFAHDLLGDLPTENGND
jgi:hypothetical protein